jgi:ABC-type dipeptide/oligopeptide/nickel transport system permease subunit
MQILPLRLSLFDAVGVVIFLFLAVTLIGLFTSNHNLIILVIAIASLAQVFRIIRNASRRIV